jgi:hypothetical protein
MVSVLASSAVDRGFEPRSGQAKDDQQSTTQKTKDRVTRTPIKTGGELRCSGRVGSSCSTSYNRRATLAKAGEATEPRVPLG